MSRTHNRSSFFKYMSLPAAKASLANRTLRWSSPLLFNDPFDVPRELSSGITAQQLVKASAGYIAQLLQSPPLDTSDLSPKLRLLVETVRKGVEPKLMKQLLSGLEETAEQCRPTGEAMDEFRRIWDQSVPNLRILCFTESPAHAAMWFHYAERYAGVVLEFRCNEHTDSPWLVARQVEYPEVKPAVYTAEGWAQLLSLRTDVAAQRIIDVATYTKASDWAYEKEWRMVTYKRPEDTGHYTDYPFHPDDLASVYVGPLATDSDRSELIELAGRFPSAKVYSVSLSMSRDFLFSEIA